MFNALRSFLLLVLMNSVLLCLNDFHLPHKCATFLDKPIKSNSIQKSLNDLGNRSYMDFLEKRHETANKNFLIHYTETGEDAVSTVDLNSNGVPDYIDSMDFYLEYVYKVEVLEMGYQSPIPDSGLGGSKAYDIYLVDLGVGYGGYYGVAFPEGNTKKVHSYIVLDNNYSETDSNVVEFGKKSKTYFEEPLTCLKITIAHEFHHSVQFRYCYQDDNRNIPELTSSFMENRLFPESLDFTSYMNYFLKNPLTISLADASTISGYSLATFGTMMQKLLGDEFFKLTWEIAENNVPLLISMDSAAFKLGNQHLDYYWCKYTEWLYHTGRRSIAGSYFPNADLMPEMRFDNLLDTANYTNNIYFTPPLERYSRKIMPLSFFAYRKIAISNNTITNDTIDVVVSNSDLDLAMFGNVSTDMLLKPDYPETTINLQSTEQNGFTKVDDLNFYCKIESQDKACLQSFGRKGVQSECFSYSYPSPIKLNEDNSIYFSAPCNYKPFDFEKPTLKIMNLDFSVAFSGTGETILVDGKKIIRLSNPEKYLNSGVYYYTVAFKDEVLSGKISVVEK